MDSNPRGEALLINIENFYDSQGNEIIENRRNGSQQDVANTKQFLEEFGYTVTVYVNVTYEKPKWASKQVRPHLYSKNDLLAKAQIISQIVILKYGYTEMECEFSDQNKQINSIPYFNFYMQSFANQKNVK